MGRMGFPNFGDRSVLDQTDMSGITITNLNMTQAGGNLALNRQLLSKALQSPQKNNIVNQSILNVTGEPSFDKRINSILRR